jgi:diketogulonate reductase-like aldo/keto reductase
MTDFGRRELLRRVAAGVAGASLAQPLAALAALPGEMLTRAIPSSGERLPVIGLGTWQTFDVGATVAERQPLEEVLSTFVQLGGRVVDSSPMYGASEDVVGDIAAKLAVHSKLFVATKVWTSGRKRGVEQMEDSMRKLRVKTVDLMQVHNLVDVNTHLDTLQQWKQEGRVRYVGITHYTAGSHDDVATVLASRPVDFVQINYSIGERDAERRLLPLAKERGVAVIANRPFAGGGLFGRLRGRPLPGWASEIDCDSWAQLMLKFVLSHPALTCAIPATSKVSHLLDNMKAGIGRMPDEKMRARIAAEAV